MLSVIGEEYIAYNESVKGQYTPMVAIQRYDGTLTYREIIKEDLLRVRDDTILPGGWLFRKSQNTSSSWVKRFALIRGSFMFFFHSPQNEKPIAIVPLEDCTLVAPDMGQKTFDEMRSYKANEGYEFDIRHNSRSTVRLYTLSEQERTDWMNGCRDRIEAANLRKVLDGTHNIPASSGNMTITSTKLNGASMLASVSSAPTTNNNHHTNNHNNSNNNNNHYNPPLPNEPYNNNYNTTSSVAGTYNPNIGNAPNHGNHTNSFQNNTQGSVINPRPPNNNNNSIYNNFPSPPPPFSSPNTTTTTANRPAIYATNNNTPAPYLASPQKTHHNLGLNKFRSRKDLGFEFVLLEENLKKKLAEQLEARTREAAARVKLFNKDSVVEAQEKEALNPINLSVLFRQSLSFVDEEIVEDPQEGTQLQMPHLKGQAIEEMLITVYRRYCGESGFMSLEQFIEFFEDSAILHTHAPHNENDEPIEEFITLLDPVRLLTLVPRNIGFSVAESYDVVNDKLHQASKTDKFIINFSQFYMILLRVTQIVYADLFDTDSTLAFNKLLQEVICPLFVWCKGHYKRGSRDVLVLEERILLLMTTYAPNLYRVFLTYGHDAVNKVPEINRIFPETAQANERGMFRNPSVVPANQMEQCAPVDSIFMTELGCLRFARDYGITPYVSSIKQLKEIFRSVNRQKVIVSSRLPTRDMMHSKLHSNAQITNATRKKELAPMKISTRPSNKGFGSSSARDYKPAVVTVASTISPRNGNVGASNTNNGNNNVTNGGVSPKRPAVPSRVASSPTKSVRSFHHTESAESINTGAEAEDDVPPPPPSPQNTIGGLGFSEFVEFVCRVAVEGMQQENYDVVFPTPFSKVLAMLTVWGVADMRKLEEVRVIHTEEVYQ